MLIAIFSDIHGNLPALETAFEDARRRGVNQIVCAGDLIGYGPFPNDSVHLIARQKIVTVAGNYDRKVLDALNAPKQLKKKMKRSKWRILDWTRRQLDQDAIRFLEKLPDDWILNQPPLPSLLITHGSPLSIEDTLYPSITQEGLSGRLSENPPAVLAVGHTHIPFVKQLRNILVINAGSIGQSVDGDPRGAYALLNLDADTAPVASIIRFRYDWRRTATALQRTDLPKRLARDITQGKKYRKPIT